MPATTLLAGSWRLDIVIGQIHWGASQQSLSLVSPKTGPAGDCLLLDLQALQPTDVTWALAFCLVPHRAHTHHTFRPFGLPRAFFLAEPSLRISPWDGMDDGDICYWLVWSSSLRALWFDSAPRWCICPRGCWFVGPGFIDAAISGWGRPMLSLVRSPRRR